MLCIFKQGASRLKNLRVIQCSLFLSQCKDLFFVRYFVERKNKLLLLLLVTRFVYRRVLEVSSDGVFETSLGSRDTVSKSRLGVELRV